MFLILWVLAVKVAFKEPANRAARSAASATTRIAAATVPHVVPVIARAIHSDAATMAIAVKPTC